jgi:hypothetical protein
MRKIFFLKRDDSRRETSPEFCPEKNACASKDSSSSERPQRLEGANIAPKELKFPGGKADKNPELDTCLASVHTAPLGDVRWDLAAALSSFSFYPDPK